MARQDTQVFLLLVKIASAHPYSGAMMISRKTPAFFELCGIHLTVRTTIPPKIELGQTHKHSPKQFFDVIKLTNSTWVHVFESHNGWTVFEITDDTDSRIRVECY